MPGLGDDDPLDVPSQREGAVLGLILIIDHRKYHLMRERRPITLNEHASS